MCLIYAPFYSREYKYWQFVLREYYSRPFKSSSLPGCRRCREIYNRRCRWNSIHCNFTGRWRFGRNFPLGYQQKRPPYNRFRSQRHHWIAETFKTQQWRCDNRRSNSSRRWHLSEELHLFHSSRQCDCPLYPFTYGSGHQAKRWRCNERYQRKQ